MFTSNYLIPRSMKIFMGMFKIDYLKQYSRVVADQLAIIGEGQVEFVRLV